jgi:hypothetical protein
MPVRIRIWIGIITESRIRIGINTLPIHNAGYLYQLNLVVFQQATDWYWPAAAVDASERSGETDIFIYHIFI